MYNVSIIIPHYNTPELLKKLLDTIPSKEDIQVIVIDDNSTKDIGQYDNLVENYKNRVEFYKNNSGIQSAGACRNIGLEHAKGIWVIFADADDFFLPKMYMCISKYFDSEQDMVIFSPTSIYLDTGKVADRHIVQAQRINDYFLDPTFENLLLVKKMPESWSKLIKRSVIEQYHLRFSETLYCDDRYFITMAGFYCKNTAISNETIYCITRNKGSLTTVLSETLFDTSVIEFIKSYQFAKEKYDSKSFECLNLNGGMLIFKAFKHKFGVKKIWRTWKLLNENKIPLLSKQMKNPIYLLKSIILNNRIIESEKAFYVHK